MRTALEIYFGFNLLLTGYCVNDDAYPLKRLLVQLLFGLSIGVLQGVGWCLKPVRTWLDERTLIVFWFSFYVIRMHGGKSVRELRFINEYLAEHKFSNEGARRRFAYAVSRVNKRNNYTYEG